MEKTIEQRALELENMMKQLFDKNRRKIKGNQKVGGTFELLGLTWKVLDISDEGYHCHAEKLNEKMQFDSKCNDWKISELREYLHTEFYKKLCEEIGEENIVPFERNLVSLDGQTEYGTCIDKVSLLSVDEYRKYRKLIPNADYWWWSLTPDSTGCNNDTRWLTVVSPSGYVRNFSCSSDDGVRPFCIFKSNIFESGGNNGR